LGADNSVFTVIRTFQHRPRHSNRCVGQTLTLDGFLAALIAGPEIVMPSEYYPEVFGGEMSETCEFASLDEANEILGLMMRHWNTIAAALNKDEVYGPILLQDENGVAHGNDWAHGFMRGMGMRHDGCAALVIPRCEQPNWPDY